MSGFQNPFMPTPTAGPLAPVDQQQQLQHHLLLQQMCLPVTVGATAHPAPHLTPHPAPLPGENRGYDASPLQPFGTAPSVEEGGLITPSTPPFSFTRGVFPAPATPEKGCISVSSCSTPTGDPDRITPKGLKESRDKWKTTTHDDAVRRNVLPPYRARFLQKGETAVPSKEQQRRLAIERLKQCLDEHQELDIQELTTCVAWNANFRPFLGSLYSFVKKHDAIFTYGPRSRVRLNREGAKKQTSPAAPPTQASSSSSATQQTQHQMEVERMVQDLLTLTEDDPSPLEPSGNDYSDVYRQLFFN